ncbi:MAG: NADH-quinone oxidoreductase subunit J [Acidimicrobiia bacterium]|nr:MAG: NADH-quinone oxidoreductase subunit J [Acidimicrobiia bacterium]
MELFVFIVAGIGALAGALTLILAKNPVYAALGMLGTLFSLAVLYVTQLAHFVAAVQVVVYAGAIMTLFLFVIMLIGVDRAEDTSEKLTSQRYGAIAVLAGAVLFAGYLWLSGTFTWSLAASNGPPPVGSIEETGFLLFAEWLLPFEVTSLLLIVASVGAVALALFRPLRRSGK